MNSQSLLGKCARSTLFKHNKIRPIIDQDYFLTKLFLLFIFYLLLPKLSHIDYLKVDKNFCCTIQLHCIYSYKTSSRESSI